MVRDFKFLSHGQMTKTTYNTLSPNFYTASMTECLIHDCRIFIVHIQGLTQQFFNGIGSQTYAHPISKLRLTKGHPLLWNMCRNQYSSDDYTEQLFLFIKKAIHRSSKMEYLEHGKEKPIVKVENLTNSEQMIRSEGIQDNLKSKTQSGDSNLRPQCEGSGKVKDLPALAPRVETRNETRNLPRGEEESGWQEFCDFEPCLKTNFGTSVNALLNFWTKMGGGKNRS
ncbi:hypothetical protein AVEN_226296-1 [Araneus ventricosus]|uniref:Uncharacterized protein n=1 Tax=Araneus ventricosus TaxID=182803 RepID=A0A4Y2DCN7_ARAVE|nr:hypothetical protein AVEN_226296-1 [Araneus ventricosus]